MQPEKAKATVDDARARGMSQLPTSEIALAPKFLDELKQIAPKRRRSKLWWVLALAVIGGGVWLGVSARGRALVARLRHQPSAAAVAPVAPIASESVAAPAVTASDSAPPVASVAPPASATATATVSATAKPPAKRPHKHR